MFLINFGLPIGQSLSVVGILDVILAVTRNYEVYSVFFFSEKERLRLTEFSYHLDYLEYFQLILDTFKLVLAFVFCTGGIIYASKTILQVWILLSMILEVILQFLNWIVKYHLLLSDVETLMPILKLTYVCIIRLLIRLYLCACVFRFLKTESNPKPILPNGSNINNTNESGQTNSSSSTPTGILSRCLGPLEPSTSSLVSSLILPKDESSATDAEWNELLPVGQGGLKFMQYYYNDVKKLASLLVTLDLAWGICRVLDTELSQAIFGNVNGILPSSSLSTPYWTEERIIRLFRIVVDLLFLWNLRKKVPPLQGGLIIPKLIEILVSIGILIFIRIVEYDLYPSVVFTIYYIFYSIDIIFRIITFCLCYKIYADFLRQNHRLVVSNAKARAQSLLSK